MTTFFYVRFYFMEKFEKKKKWKRQRLIKLRKQFKQYINHVFTYYFDFIFFKSVISASPFLCYQIFLYHRPKAKCLKVGGGGYPHVTFKPDPFPEKGFWYSFRGKPQLLAAMWFVIRGRLKADLIWPQACRFIIMFCPEGAPPQSDKRTARSLYQATLDYWAQLELVTCPSFARDYSQRCRDTESSPTFRTGTCSSTYFNLNANNAQGKSIQSRLKSSRSFYPHRNGNGVPIYVLQAKLGDLFGHL